MQIHSALTLASAMLIGSTAASHIPEKRQTTTCDEPGFILCPPNAPSASTGGSSGGPYVPPYSLGPTPFQFINSLGKRQQAQFCCNPKLECRILTDYQVYICLDNTNQDFFMNDGSNGNAASGMYYNAPAEANINIFTGDYVYANGTRGNGYDDTGSPRPSREVTGTTPQPTGDVVHDAAVAETATVTSAPSSTPTGAGSSANANGASTATSSPAATAKPNAGTLASCQSPLVLASLVVFGLATSALW